MPQSLGIQQLGLPAWENGIVANAFFGGEG
jgi:hypothetical protein